MPVVELSSTTTVEVPLLYTISIRPVMPEWMNVESPMTASDRRACSFPRAVLKPCSALTDAPIQTQASIIDSGALAPSV